MKIPKAMLGIKNNANFAENNRGIAKLLYQKIAFLLI